MTATRRRDLAVALLIALLAVVWILRGDSAGAGAPGAQGIDVVYVTVGTNFPDALGIGPGAALYGAPVLLVPTDPPLPGVTATELARLDPKKIVIVGGTAAVSTAMEDAIADAVSPFTEFERLAGSNRYDTNTQFSESVFPYEASVSVGPRSFTAYDPGDVVLVDGGSSVYGNLNAQLIAPLTLPHGAEILSITVMGTDTDTGDGGAPAGADVGVTLVVTSSIGLSTFSCGELTSGGVGDFEVTCEPASPIGVDNSTTAYGVMISGADGDPKVNLVSVHYRIGHPPEEF